jgi:hypothetical protein
MAMMTMTYALAALAVVALAQTVVTWQLARRVRAAAPLDRRLAHFAEALALLTDTTETGLANLATELEQSTRRRGTRASVGGAPRSSARSTAPKATSRRIVTATRCGKPIAEIAAAEGLSESEVMLHLGMSVDPDAKGSRDERDRMAQGQESTPWPAASTSL